jgi:predicted CxxxxCH...CXXCH cytochrome family protein
MGKVIKKQIQGMSLWAKISLVTTLTLLVTVFMYQGWYKPQQAQAAIGTLTNWTNAYSNTTIPGATGISFPVAAGANRMLVVALSYQSTGGATLTTTGGVTYGGVAMTASSVNATDTATSMSAHSIIYYLPENAIMDGTGKTLAVNITGGGTIVRANVWYTVLTGVNGAATPAARNFLNNAAGTTAAWASALPVNAGEKALYVATATRAAGAVTWPAPTNGFWATGGDTQTASTTGVGLVRARDLPAANTTDTASSTGITSSRVTMTGIAFAPATLTNPTVTSASPNNQTQGTGPTTVTINGTGFQSGAVVTFSGTGVTAGASSFTSSSIITVPVTVTGGAAATARTITVTNPDTGAGTGGTFTVNAAIVNPTVTSASLNNQTQGTGPTNVTITGTGFQSGAVVTFSGTGVTAGASTFNSSTSITVPVTVTAGALTGLRNITVTNTDTGAGTGNNLFTINAAASCTSTAPTVSLGANGTVLVGGGKAYTVSVTNTDSVACGNSTFTLSIASETGNTGSYALPSVVSPTSIGPLAPGASSSSTLTVTAQAGATVGHTLLTTVNAADATNHTGKTGSGSVTTTVAAASPNTLMHNSANTSTKYGTWGVGKDCTWCHTTTSTNIKRINETITTPNGNVRNVVFTRMTASVTTSMSVFGNDARSNLNVSTNVCEVCHHQTAYHQYSASKIADKTHNNRADCTSCHTHNVGFYASCASCHGNPPNSLATLVTSPSPTGALGGAVGAHATHVTSEGMVCNTCHTGNTMPTVSNTIQMGFNVNATNWTGFGGTAAYGTFSGHTPLTAPYSFVASNAGTVVGTSASYRTSCNVYCHGNWAGSNRTINPSWIITDGSQSACGTCHAATAANPPQTGRHVTHASNAVGNYGFACTKCHPNATGGFSHVNGSVQWRLSSATNGLIGATATYTPNGGSAAISGSTAGIAPSSTYGSCNNVYCHSNVQAAGGNGAPSSYTNPSWNSGAALGCSGCHADMSTASGTGSHVEHALNYRLACNNCHIGYTSTTIATATHVNRNIDLTFTAGTIAPTTTYSKNNSFLAGSAVYGTCNTSYCHSNAQTNGAKAAMYRQPTWGSTLDCGSCHKNMATFTGASSGSHVKHANTANDATNKNYGMTCSLCHANKYTATYANTTTHVSGKIDVGFTGTAVGTVYSKTSPFNPASGAYGTCSTSPCHNSGRGGGIMGTASNNTPTWGGTTTCLSCHAGRATTGLNPPARSTAGFTLTTTHSQHLKYTTAEINCQTCHYKTASSVVGQGHTTLKDYSGVAHHVNGTRDVTFSGIAYGSYTSYKSIEVGAAATTRTCNNNACHGGKSRSAWSASSTTNDNTCVHCHGVVGTPTTLPTANTVDNRKYYAPGYNKAGTSTDQVKSRNDLRVGAHFMHLSSAYMRNIKCNECHIVPSKPFEGNHMAQNRYNSTTLAFGQSSSAMWDGFSKTKLATFGGYTNGTATKAATCSSVYCHGSRLKNGDIAGSYRKPYWSYSGMVRYSDPATACGRCHGLPPGSVSASHATATLTGPTNPCSQCHGSVVNALGQIINKDLHINGKVEASSHAWPYPGAVHRGPAGAWDYTNCKGCHTNAFNAGTYPAVRANGAGGVYCYGCHTNTGNFNSANAGCGDCHGATGAGSSGEPTGANVFPNWSGSHSAHIAQTYACTDCHNGGGAGSLTHGNYSSVTKVRTDVKVAFNTAKSGTAAVWTYGGGTNMTCTTSNCHGQKSPAWGSAVPAQSCRRCHGSQTTAYVGFTSVTIAPGTGNIDTGRNVGVSIRGGVHQEHLKGSSNISSPVRCVACHTVPSVVAHANRTTATVDFTVGIAGNSSHSPSNSRVSGVMNCSNVYCHQGARPEGAAGVANTSGLGARPALTWNNGALLGNTSVTDTCTNKCHGMPPGAGVLNDSHASLVAGPYDTPAKLASCSSVSPATGCHPTINEAPTLMTNIFANKSLHIDGKVDGGSCSGCHGYQAGTWGVSPKLDSNGYAIGAHEKHITYLTTKRFTVTLNPTGDSYGSASPSWTNVCGVCHIGGTHMNGTLDVFTANNPPYFFGTAGATTYAGVWKTANTTTAKTCSNISCHYFTSPSW